jgi:hypothetical protein
MARCFEIPPAAGLDFRMIPAGFYPRWDIQQRKSILNPASKDFAPMFNREKCLSKGAIPFVP